MAIAKERGIRITSSAFGLRQDKEKMEGRRITIDTMAEETDLAKMTVRRFLEPSNDVGNSPIVAAAVIAGYFGVGVGDLLTVHREGAQEVPA